MERDSVVIIAPRGMGKTGFLLSPSFEELTGVSPTARYLYGKHVRGQPCRACEAPFRLHLSSWETGQELPSCQLCRARVAVLLGLDYKTYVRSVDRKRRKTGAWVPKKAPMQLRLLYSSWASSMRELEVPVMYLIANRKINWADRFYKETTRDEFFRIVCGGS